MLLLFIIVIFRLAFSLSSFSLRFSCTHSQQIYTAFHYKNELEFSFILYLEKVGLLAVFLFILCQIFSIAHSHTSFHYKNSLVCSFIFLLSIRCLLPAHDITDSATVAMVLVGVTHTHTHNVPTLTHAYTHTYTHVIYHL